MILVMPSLEWDLQFLTGPVSVTCVETGLGRNQNLIHQDSSLKLMFSKKYAFALVLTLGNTADINRYQMVFYH